MLNPFKSPEQGRINGEVHFVGRSGVGRDSFVGPVIANVGLLKCPGAGDHNETSLKKFEVLAIDPDTVHWVPLGANGCLPDDEDEFFTGVPKVYIGHHKYCGIGMVRLDNCAYQYYSFERSQPYHESFEVLCVKSK